MNASRTRRALLLVNALIVVMMLLAACGGGQPAPAPTVAPAATNAPAPTAAAAATNAPEPAKAPAATEAPAAQAPATTGGLNCENLSGDVTVWVMEFDPHVNGWNNVAESFMQKYPNIKVKVEPQGAQGDMLAKYKASLSAKSGGDVFTTPGNMVYEWSMTKQILPLTPKLWSYDDAKKALWPEYILQSQVDNQVWAAGIPDPPGDTGLIANEDQLKEAGLEKLEKFATTEQMLEYAQKLTQKSGDQLTRAGLSPRESNFGTYIYSYIADQGGKFWDNDTQKFNFNTPEAKNAMQLILDLFNKYKVDDVKLPNALDGLLQGTVSMAYMWPEFMPYAKGAAPDLTMGFIMKPAYSGDKPAIFSHADTWSVVIPAYTKMPDQAYCVVNYLMSEEGQLRFLDANPGLSPLRSLVLNNDYFKTGKGAYLKPVIEAMKAGNMRYWGPWLDGSTLQYDILWTTIDAMINGQLTLDDGLKKLTDDLNNQVAQSRARVPEAPDTTVYFDALPADISTVEAGAAAPAPAPAAAAADLKCDSQSGDVTVWVMEFDPHVNGWNNVAESFMQKYPNIKVKVEPQGAQGDMLAKYKASLSAKSGGDVFTTPGNMVYEWSMTKQILPLTPKLWSYDDAKKALWPEYILQSQVDNQVWAAGIPDPPGDTGLIANEDQLKEAGLEKLEKFATTEQMLEYAQKLTQKSGDQLTRAGLSPRESNFGTYIYSYIADQGGKFWDNDTQKFNFNTPEAKNAMQLILDLFNKYKVDDVKLPNALDGLLQGTVSMAYMWPEFMPYAKGAAPDLTMGFIMKPAYSGDKPAIFSHADTWSVVIPAYTKMPDQAYCVVNYLMSEEGQLRFLDANPGLSPLRSLVLNNDYFKTGKGAYLKPVIEAMKAGNMRYWGPWLDGSTLQYDILWTTIDAMINGQLTLDDGLKKLTDDLNNQVAQSRARVPEAPDTTVYFDQLPAELSTAE